MMASVLGIAGLLAGCAHATAAAASSSKARRPNFLFILAKSYNIEKYEILEPIKFNTKVKTGDVIAKLKNRNITTPFDGIIGKRDFSNDIDVSQS